MSVEHLEWDSKFFAFRIGRSPSDNPVDVIADAATKEGLECVYIEANAALDADAHDLRLVDRRILLSASVGGHTLAATDVRSANDTDAALLGPALDRLASWSRFARDPRFGVDSARRLYDAWLERAITSPNERVGVIDDAAGPIGFVTVRLDSDAEIGLIGVTVDGTGAGQKLIDWAFEAAAESTVLEVVTQADNTRALTLYERNGFVRKAETFMYHLWLNNAKTDD